MAHRIADVATAVITAVAFAVLTIWAYQRLTRYGFFLFAFSGAAVCTLVEALIHRAARGKRGASSTRRSSRLDD